MGSLRLLALLSLLTSPAPRVLRVSVASEAGCDVEAVHQALERHFGPGKVVIGPPLEGQPSLHLVREADGTLGLELAEGRAQPIARRSFAATGSCADVSETVALLTEAWLQQLPWKGEGILPAGPEASAAAPTVVDGPRPSQAVVPEPQPAPKPGAAEAAIPGPPISKTSVTPEVVHAAVPPPAPGHAPPPRVSLQLGFGGDVDGKVAEPGYFGSALVDVAVDRRRRFGVGVDFELLDTLDTVTPAGSLSIQRQALRVFGRYAFNPDQGLRLLVGLGGDRYAASPSGFATNTPRSVVDPEVWGSAFWLQPIWKRLYFFGQAGVAVQLQQEQFYVNPDDPTDVLVTFSPVWLSLTVGLGAQLF